MMRKLDEPLLSLELFDECENLTRKRPEEEDFRNEIFCLF
jgi:hypothetical protein